MNPIVKLLIFLIISLLFRTNTLICQTLPSGPQVLTFHSDIDDTEQPYGLYLPKNFNPNKKYPLVVMLHGAGSNHRLSLRRVFGKSNEVGATDVETSRIFPAWKDIDYIVASPYARGTAGYQGVPEKDVYDVLVDVKNRFPIDNDRVYLTGLSMGGGGTLWIGLTHPDIWAAIAPVCPAPPVGTEVFAPNALNIPVHFFQGGADPVVNPEGTRKWVSSLKDLGSNVEYTEYPGIQHNSWEKAYQDENIFKWFAPFKRNLFPDTVRFVTDQYKYDSAYWVRLDKIIPGQTADIKAILNHDNLIKVTTNQLESFTLQLKDHPHYSISKKTAISIDGQLINLGIITGTLSFEKIGKKWTAIKYSLSTQMKHQGQGGPIFDGFSSRQVYVYGTKDSPDPEVLKTRIALALQAANWSVYRGEFLGRMMFFPRVISDKEVRPSDLESSNLILFGTRESNSMITTDVTPISLTPDNLKSYGLIYIYPNNGHYIVVSSGLPWWTGRQEKGYRFMPLEVSGLSLMKDYLLFKGDVNSIEAEGYFDNNWKLGESQKLALKNSGVVSLF